MKIGIAVAILIAIAAITVLIEHNVSATTTPSTPTSSRSTTDERSYRAGYQHGLRWLEKDRIGKGLEIVKTGECVGSGSLQPHRRSYEEGCLDAVHGKPEKP